MKIDYKPEISDSIKIFQKIKIFLDNEWVKVMDLQINISSKKIHIRNQISLMEYGEEKE